MTYPKALKKADIASALYVRTRDEGKPCISCGSTGRKLQCGHFIPRAYMIFRYDERNINGQCMHCNYTLEGNHDNYGKALAKLYGQEFVDYMEREKHKHRKYNVNELLLLTDYFTRKTAELKKMESV
jgi:hypothetical protein